MQRADVTRNKLFDAAASLIGEYGYDDTTVDQIAERAGVAKGTVYYYFPSKSDLVEAMITSKTSVLTGRFREIHEAHRDEPMKALEELLCAQLEFLSNDQEYSKMLMAELWRVDRPWYPALSKMRQQLVDTFCTVVKEGADVQVFREDVDPDFAGYAVFGMATFVALDRLTHEPHRSFDDLLRQLTASVCSALKGPC